MGDLKEEKLQILNMVEDGKITSQEGMNLLQAISGKNGTKKEYSNNRNPKWFKVKISESDSKNKVNVTIPLSLINLGMKFANRFAPSFIPELESAGLSEEDICEIFEEIKNGASGKIVDIESEDGEKVEIIVE